MVLEHAARRPAPASSVIPTTACVELGAPDPPLQGYPTVEDLDWLRQRGVSVTPGSVDCLHNAPVPALYLSPCMPERWFNTPDEYEVATIVIYKTGVPADEDILFLVVYAVHTDSGWTMRRDEFRDLPPGAYAAGAVEEAHKAVETRNSWR